MSILTCNTCNGAATGDWQFNKANVKNKTVIRGRQTGVSLNTFDAIVQGDPHLHGARPPALPGNPDPELLGRGRVLPGLREHDADGCKYHHDREEASRQASTTRCDATAASATFSP